MKKLLAFLLLFNYISFADENQVISSADSVNLSVQSLSEADSVNISEIVKAQFEAAQAGIIKSNINYQVTKKVEKILTPKKPSGKSFYLIRNFNSDYLLFIVYIVSSALILAAVFGRRLLKKFMRSSKNKLKKSINLIRDEKLVTIKNKKLNAIRKRLFDSSGLYDVSESTISNKARDLNLGKGEIILAAKLKAFQLSKISR